MLTYVIIIPLFCQVVQKFFAGFRCFFAVTQQNFSFICVVFLFCQHKTNKKGKLHPEFPFFVFLWRFLKTRQLLLQRVAHRQVFAQFFPLGFHHGGRRFGNKACIVEFPLRTGDFLLDGFQFFVKARLFLL